MPHRLMKLPFDPSHLEMPVNIVVAVVSSLAALGVAAWQWLGSVLAQFPTPDQVSCWQERDVYLCALIIFAAAIAYMGRWIVTKMLDVIRKNTESSQAVATALTGFTAKVDSVVMSAVTNAMAETFKPEPPGHRPVLDSANKRIAAPEQ